MSISEEIVNNTVRRVQILEEIEVIRANQIQPLRNELSKLDKNNRDLVCERGQETFEFQHENTAI